MPKSKYKKAIGKATGVVAPSADWVTRLMKKVQAQFAKEKRSKKENKQRKKEKEIRATRLSRPTQKQLGWLSEGDYKEVMGILKGKK